MSNEELGTRACVCVDGVDSSDILFLESVVVLNCGGTINMSLAPVRGPAGIVEKKLENIRRDMEFRGIRVQSESVFKRPPDSSNIGETEWSLIINKLKEVCNKKALIAERLRARGVKLEKGGIVVAHGTDTLQVTALIVALEFSIQTMEVPIVFTASHSPIEAIGSDGLNNLRKSLFIAKERFAWDSPNLPPAVYVLIGQDVHLASRLTKVRTMPDSDGRYFFSFPAPVGRITGDKFRLRIEDAFLNKMLPDSPVFLARDSPRKLFGIVEHLYVDRFSNVSGLEDVKSRASFYRSEIPLENRGIAFVVQGDFSANPELSNIARLLGDISREGPVFVGSMKSFAQVGRVTGDANVFLLPKSMTHAKAQAKLRWLLSFSGLGLNISDALNTNFAGEVFDSKELPEWINYETFPDKTDGTEVVIVYPDIHWKVLAHAIRRLQGSAQSSRRLFLFGFGDGHVPAINHPVGEIVGRYVDREILGGLSFDRNEISVDGIVGQLASHIERMSDHQLKDFLNWKYYIDEKKLRGVLMGEFAQDIISRELVKIKRTIESVMDRMTKGRPVSIKNKNQVIEGMVKNIRIAGFEDEARKFLRDVQMEWSCQLIDIIKSKFPDLIVRRVIKDAVMASSPLLNCIGVAVDLGINVKIRSLAVKSRTNTLNYEPGNILMMLGVDSEETPGWKTNYLKPRQNNLLSSVGSRLV